MQCYDELRPIMISIVNDSLSSGVFPTALEMLLSDQSSKMKVEMSTTTKTIDL